MVGATSNWEDELGRWLEPFLDRLGPQGAAADVPMDASLMKAK